MRWSDCSCLVLKRLTHSDWFGFSLSLSSYQCCILINASVIGDSKVHPRTGHESSEGGIYSFFNLCVRWGCVVNVTPRAFYSSTGIQPPDHPACSEWLYRLSYPGPNHHRRYIIWVTDSVVKQLRPPRL